VLLEPNRAQLDARLAAMASSGGHFMPAGLLDSQLQTLQYAPEVLAAHFVPQPGAGINATGRGLDAWFPSEVDIVSALFSLHQTYML